MMRYHHRIYWYEYMIKFMCIDGVAGGVMFSRQKEHFIWCKKYRITPCVVESSHVLRWCSKLLKRTVRYDTLHIYSQYYILMAKKGARQNSRKVQVVAESVEDTDINSSITDHSTVLQNLQSKKGPIVQSWGDQLAAVKGFVQIHDFREDRTAKTVSPSVRIPNFHFLEPGKREYL